MAKAHGGKSGKEGARAPNPAGVVTVRESFRADQTPRMRHVAFSAKEIEASIEAVKGPPLKGGPTKAEAKRHAVPIDPARAGAISRKDGSERQAEAMAAFDKLIQERPVLGPGMQDDALERARDQYCLIGKRLVEFFFADESINSATLTDDIERSLRRALAQMDEDKQRRLIVALMALAGELQSARVLSTVPPARLAQAGVLIAKAHALIAPPAAAEVHPTADDVPLFADRVRDATYRRETAIEFFGRVWRPLIDAGTHTGSDIRQRDRKLYQALSAHQKREGGSLNDLFPFQGRGRSNAVAPLSDDERRERHAAKMRRLRNARNTPS